MELSSVPMLNAIILGGYILGAIIFPTVVIRLRPHDFDWDDGAIIVMAAGWLPLTFLLLLAAPLFGIAHLVHRLSGLDG